MSSLKVTGKKQYFTVFVYHFSKDDLNLAKHSKRLCPSILLGLKPMDNPSEVPDFVESQKSFYINFSHG